MRCLLLIRLGLLVLGAQDTAAGLRPQSVTTSLVSQKWRVAMNLSGSGGWRPWAARLRCEHPLYFFEDGTYVLGEARDDRTALVEGEWSVEPNPYELLDRLFDVVLLEAEHDGVRVEWSARLYCRDRRNTPRMSHGIVAALPMPSGGDGAQQRARRPRVAGSFRCWADEPWDEHPQEDAAWQ